jgi:sec-independent protein translocase protein TatA
MGLSFGHIALLLVIVLVVFGAGRLPQVMGDLGKGLRSFKNGLKEGEQEGEEEGPPSKTRFISSPPENDNEKTPDKREA